jgi:hypothetical protein
MILIAVPLALTGIAVNAAIVLIDAANAPRHQRMSVQLEEVAHLESGRSVCRLEPEHRSRRPRKVTYHID